MSILSLRGIAKSFAGNAILKGVSLEAEEGEFVALVGPSGCGKSTLLRIVAGLDHADRGEIVIGGREVSPVAAADRNVAMVFQSYALYPHLTAGQNIAVPLAMRRLSAAERFPFVGNLLPGQRQIRADIQRQVREMASSLKIDHLLDRKPGQMSGGQRQRVALARAMVRRPSVFLMDEPLSNLDANLRVHARSEIVELHRRAGVPTLYVTHDQSEALSMADRVAVMIGGTLLQLASPREIYDDPAHVEVARFLGQPRINVVETRMDPSGIVRFGPLTLAGEKPASGEASVMLAVRPEFVRFSGNPDGILMARVERTEFLGSEVIVHARLGAIGETIVAKISPAEASSLTTGMPVSVEIEPDRAMLFAASGERLRAKTVAAAAALEKAHG
ncbi:ABC transporter ATP-binding protein [Sinorhizobium prairiense]|jgi:multiple sugar transport system ATP-binding protein|uniref:ABC transporter ATP-binding protein n=1 Tax=unclassified Sinorhizobium TaxID=2613772 RepID=UPI0023D7F49E|nr:MULTISPECIES: ABC transporter ATP-binding protein [unclassified Sinorhizobium]WEJ12371.1 ABC transporter ATP-binding protein [Sinorhizobium sp. M103]WEJ18804.1 ABC transporter ATP-binding protein [Sinorhizobium sp. K101]WEJ39264.1 ABC transporter ATP-binding protein [Sinorhizobium sp. C101]